MRGLCGLLVNKKKHLDFVLLLAEMAGSSRTVRVVAGEKKRKRKWQQDQWDRFGRVIHKKTMEASDSFWFGQKKPKNG